MGMDEENTGKLHLYAVNDQTTGDKMRPDTQCITCGLRHKYQNCSHFNAYFSSSNLSKKIFIIYLS